MGKETQKARDKIEYLMVDNDLVTSLLTVALILLVVLLVVIGT